jgi:hypothetical protein
VKVHSADGAERNFGIGIVMKAKGPKMADLLRCVITAKSST